MPWKMPLILLLLISTLTLGAVYGARLPDDYRCLRIITGSNYGAGFDEANLGYALFDLGSGQYRDDPRANPRLQITSAPDLQHEVELERAADGTYTLWIQDSEGGAIPLQDGIAPAMILRNANFLVGWSPDSSRIAYLWQARAGKMYLSTANADGSGHQTALFTRSDRAAENLFNVRIFGWSADNAIIAIAEGRADWTNSYAFWSAENLTRIDTVQQQLYMGAWSPQGHTLAAIHAEAGRQVLKLLTPDTNQEIVVDILPKAPVELIGWSRNSRYLVLITYGSVCQPGNPCASHWRYDFYDSSGKTLQSNLIGARLGLDGGSDLDTPPSGRIVTATWLGDEWWFLSESGELVALDVVTGARREIASGVIDRFGDEMFYVSARQRSRMWAVSNFTLLPDGDYVLAPTQHDGKIRVDLISRESRQTLVENADSLNDSLLWVWDGAWVAASWSRHGESTRLTLAQVGTPFLQTIDSGYDTISSISSARAGWLGYIGQQRDERALEIVNVQTSERRKLLSSLGTQPFWNVTFGGDVAGIFVSSVRDALFSGQVYVVSPDGRATPISDDAVNVPIWSPDGVGFVVMRLNNLGNAILEVVAPDGTPRQTINLGKFLATQPAIEGWTRCE